MDITYFIINNIRYLFKYNKYRLEIYKLVNDEECELSSKEKAYFASILANSNSYILKSSTLDNIISNNDSISNNDLIPELLEIIENFIPGDCRENFYRNLKTLKINEVSQDKLGDETTPAHYNMRENTININSNNQFMKDDPIKRTVLMHELLHMASTNYDKENAVMHTGFHDVYDEGIHKPGNLGINEGFTEKLAYFLAPPPGYLNTGYFIEMNLVTQLMCIVGEGTFIKAYFTNNLSLIKNKMLELNPNEDKLNFLFSNMELLNFFKDDMEKTDSLYLIQSSLLDYFSIKCGKLEIEIIDDQEKTNVFKDTIINYNNSLLLSSTLGVDSNKYENLDKINMKAMLINSQYSNLFTYGEVSDSKVIGYAKITILAILSGLVSVGIIILGMLF